MFWLIFTVILWGMIHSFTASFGFKESLRQKLGNGFMRSYRLLYNIFSIVSITPILYLMVVLPDRDLYQVPSPWNFVMLAGRVLSAFLLLIAVFQTDTLSFVGLRQIFEEESSGKLVTQGFYRIVRHPLYAFSLLVLWLSPKVSVNSFFVYLALTVYVFIGAYFEERKLLREFGQEYADYRSVTPMLIPGSLKNLRQRQS